MPIPSMSSRSGPRVSKDARSTSTRCRELAERVAAARYTVFVFEPAALPQPHAALLIEALNGSSRP